MAAKRKLVGAARPIDRLMAAMDRCAVARGEAQWTNGYRTGTLKGGEQDRLWPKEQAQFREVESAEKNFRRLAMRLLRGARVR
jgi:hypothetical protein